METASSSCALPSKGRLMEQCNAALAKAGLTVAKSGPARGYKGEIDGLPGVEVNFVSSGEIAQFLKSGAAHLGITGEDLIRETMPDADERVALPAPARLRPRRRGGGGARLLARRAAHGGPGGDVARLIAACTAGACASPPST